MRRLAIIYSLLLFIFLIPFNSAYASVWSMNIHNLQYTPSTKEISFQIDSYDSQITGTTISQITLVEWYSPYNYGDVGTDNTNISCQPGVGVQCSGQLVTGFDRQFKPGGYYRVRLSGNPDAIDSQTIPVYGVGFNGCLKESDHTLYNVFNAASTSGSTTTSGTTCDTGDFQISGNSGDITQVIAGTGLTGGAYVGDATLSLADSGVTTTKINDLAVTTAKIAASAITEAKLAAGAVTTSIINDLAVITAKIADGAVTTAKIANGAVTDTQLAVGAVTESIIANLAVTTAKLDDLAVTTAKINDLAVTAGKIATGAVTTAKIADNAVTSDKLSADFQSGWTAVGDTWTRASADSPTFVITVPSGATSKYTPGDRIKLTQESSTKYFIATAVTDTTLTVYGGTDYTLADTATYAISGINYSHVKAPVGFPLNPAKWTVEVTETTIRTVSSPTQNVWYTPSGMSTITVPIGYWNLSWQGSIQGRKNTGVTVSVSGSLSTSNNSESDSDFSVLDYEQAASAVDLYVLAPASRWKHVTLAAKTVDYPIIRTVYSGVTGIYFNNQDTKYIVRAVCAYL